jgi:ketosteroid isomerase-like protein
MSLEDMQKRLQALEDLEAIRQMHCEYMSCLDEIRFADALDFFMDDAEVEVRNSGVMKGRENYSKIYLGTLAVRKERHDAHLVAQPVVTVDGDTAHGHWIVYMLFSVPQIDWIQGRHDCEYRKVDGVWKFSKLKFARTLASRPELYP